MMQWKDSDILHNPKCGGIGSEVTMDNIDEDPLGSIFFSVLNGPTYYLNVHTSDPDKIGTYPIKIWVFYKEFKQSSRNGKGMTVEIAESCDGATLILDPLSDQFHRVLEAAYTLPLTFTVTPESCRSQVTLVETISPT